MFRMNEAVASPGARRSLATRRYADTVVRTLSIALPFCPAGRTYRVNVRPSAAGPELPGTVSAVNQRCRISALLLHWHLDEAGAQVEILEPDDWSMISATSPERQESDPDGRPLTIHDAVLHAVRRG